MGIMIQEKIVEMRSAAGLTQRELAKILDREHSFVARVEQGERRVDLAELFLICKACGTSPEKEISGLIKKFSFKQDKS